MKHESFSTGNSELPKTTMETENSAEKALDDARLQAIGFAAVESMIQTHNDSGPNGDFIKRENSHEYKKDRFDQNLEFLSQNNTPDYLVDTYQNLMADFPQLRNVELNAFRPGIPNACFNSVGPDRNNLRPTVSYQFSNPDLYLTEKHDIKNDLQGIDTVYLEIALRTGARPSEVMNNKKLVQTFILCHEFGHALDFNDNYLEPALAEERKSGEKRGLGARALKKSYVANRRRRKEDKAQLLYGSIESDSQSELRSVMRSRLLALGANVKDKREMEMLQMKSYRKTRSESIADSFAMDYVMKHYNEFFYDPKSGEDADGRLPTYIGRDLRFPEEYLPFLDFVPGSHIACRFKDKDGKDRTVNSCYMANRLRIGSDFVISTSGDPTDSKSMYSLGTINGVYIRPQRDNKNFFFLKMEDGGSAVFTMSENGAESPEIDVDGSEIEKRYYIGIGSNLALLKVGQADDSPVGAGGLLMGKLKYSMRDGEGIVLSGASDYSNTSTVKRFYRRWKRYYAETKTSTYEILPILKKH